MTYLLGFLTGIGIVVVSVLLFFTVLFLYVEIQERILMKYCKEKLVDMRPPITFSACYKCGETSEHRLVRTFWDHEWDGKWECFHSCNINPE